MKNTRKKQLPLILAIGAGTLLLLILLLFFINGAHFTANITDLTIDVGSDYTISPAEVTYSDRILNRTGKTITATSTGTYNITYTATDSYGNSTSATRTVTVNPIKNNVTTITPSGKVIYLTFDDGPGPYTEELLCILAKHNVKATFFVVNGKYNNLIAKEYAAGHSIGVHSYTHNYAQIYASTDAYWRDFNAMNDVIRQQTGTAVSIFRFPGGSSNAVSKKYCIGIMSQLAFQASSLGYQYFDWNVTSGDAGGTTDTNQVFKNITNGVSGKNTAVVLQHDIKSFSVAAVEQTIVWGLSNGYTFLPLDATSPAAHQHIGN